MTGWNATSVIRGLAIAGLMLGLQIPASVAATDRSSGESSSLADRTPIVANAMDDGEDHFDEGDDEFDCDDEDDEDEDENDEDADEDDEDEDSCEDDHSDDEAGCATDDNDVNSCLDDGANQLAASETAVAPVASAVTEGDLDLMTDVADEDEMVVWTVIGNIASVVTLLAGSAGGLRLFRRIRGR